MQNNKTENEMKLKSLILCAAVVALAASCDNGSNSSHYIGVPYPLGVAYADQQTDTLAVQSTDSWAATVTDGDWFTPNEFSKNISTANRIDYSQYALNIQTSNGKNRKATFVIKSNGKTLRKTYVQVSWLNITNPNPVIIRSDSTIAFLYDTEHFAELKAYCYFTPDYKGGNDKITGTIYSSSVEIATSDEWINLKDGDDRYVKSVILDKPAKTDQYEISVPVFVTENTGSAKRRGKITLTTSNGITQTIDVRQGVKTDK